MAHRAAAASHHQRVAKQSAFSLADDAEFSLDTEDDDPELLAALASLESHLPAAANTKQRAGRHAAGELSDHELLAELHALDEPPTRKPQQQHELLAELHALDNEPPARNPQLRQVATTVAAVATAAAVRAPTLDDHNNDGDDDEGDDDDDGLGAELAAVMRAMDGGAPTLKPAPSAANTTVAARGKPPRGIASHADEVEDDFALMAEFASLANSSGGGGCAAVKSRQRDNNAAAVSTSSASFTGVDLDVPDDEDDDDLLVFSNPSGVVSTAARGPALTSTPEVQHNPLRSNQTSGQQQQQQRRATANTGASAAASSSAASARPPPAPLSAASPASLNMKQQALLTPAAAALIARYEALMVGVQAKGRAAASSGATADASGWVAELRGLQAQSSYIRNNTSCAMLRCWSPRGRLLLPYYIPGAVKHIVNLGGILCSLYSRAHTHARARLPMIAGCDAATRCGPTRCGGSDGGTARCSGTHEGSPCYPRRAAAVLSRENRRGDDCRRSWYVWCIHVYCPPHFSLRSAYLHILLCKCGA